MVKTSQKRKLLIRASTVCTLAILAAASLSLAGCGGSSPSTPTPANSADVHDTWTWVGGANVIDQSGVYGTLGTAAPSNAPGARAQAVTWTDAAGNFWLFGGSGYDSIAATNLFGGTTPPAILSGTYLNDLWKYSNGQWTWMSGSNLADQPATYGVLGTAAAGNIPPARQGAAGWTDSSQNLWLFGGESYPTGNRVIDLSAVNHLDDLWKYSAGQWTWMGGSNSGEQPGIYGTLGVSAPANIPGGRFHAASWTDPSGNFWLFGGDALDANGTSGFLNDLWKYSPGQWTWIAGSNIGLQPGVYGTQGASNASNVPGGRGQSFTWTDASGTLWLFGGFGYDSQGTQGYLNDLWKYSAGQWTWVAGSNLANQAAAYGTLGVGAPANTPSARSSGTSWIDAAGSLWLFGGYVYQGYYFGDLWKYSGGQWTWISGANTPDETQAYGILKTPATANTPGARISTASWTDSSGNLWLLGGNTHDPNPTTRSLGILDYRNDLWKLQP